MFYNVNIYDVSEDLEELDYIDKIVVEKNNDEVNDIVTGEILGVYKDDITPSKELFYVRDSSLIEENKASKEDIATYVNNFSVSKFAIALDKKDEQTKKRQL